MPIPSFDVMCIHFFNIDLNYTSTTTAKASIWQPTTQNLYSFMAIARQNTRPAPRITCYLSVSDQLMDSLACQPVVLHHAGFDCKFSDPEQPGVIFTSAEQFMMAGKASISGREVRKGSATYAVAPMRLVPQTARGVVWGI